MVDVDKFYNTEPLPIGLPDFWPSNARPAPGHFERILDRMHMTEHWGDLKVKTPKAEPKTDEASVAADEAQAAEESNAEEKT